LSDIIFPNLGITFENVNRIAFSIFGISIYWYAIFVVIGIGAGYFFGGVYAPKKTGQDPKVYTDFAIWVIPAAILGGRLFYLIFSPWPAGANFFHLFNLRAGGIAIWGVIITAILVSFLYARHKKINFLNFVDTAIVGLIIGHVIGRFGNFMNREAFGGFAANNNPFAMQIRLDQVHNINNVTSDMLSNSIIREGIEYIQVHPVMLYEAAINLALFIFLNIYRKHKKFDGELIAMYLVSYGITRFFLETLRTDQLHIGGSGIAIAHILSALAAVLGGAMLVRGYMKVKKKAA